MQRPTQIAEFSATPSSFDERYHALTGAIDAAFCIIEMVFADDRPVDYRFVEVNSRFESQTGLVDPVGRTASELVPDLEAFWFDTYGRVATTGEVARFEQPFASARQRRDRSLSCSPTSPSVAASQLRRRLARSGWIRH
jgi:PAS domain-containing protein